uniref:Uncharacterized protein n=1 Tax=Trypanosoma congolense (strain IL3000) TaxID=1068625 RepID=G0UQK0_TRYCI|nr:hypothetical protein, unlikely [Trypanosoma congolense IL3000]
MVAPRIPQKKLNNTFLITSPNVYIYIRKDFLLTFFFSWFFSLSMWPKHTVKHGTFAFHVLTSDPHLAADHSFHFSPSSLRLATVHITFFPSFSRHCLPFPTHLSICFRLSSGAADRYVSNGSN